jgi:hypothetical protein
MGRFFSSFLAVIFTMAWLNVAGAQATRPVLPQARPQTSAGQPPQMNPQQQTPPAVNRTIPVINQPGAPIKPSPGTEQAANTPVTPPTVSYRDGLLTVQATNSTLGSVLNAIRSKTGIEFEGLEGASDHVALSLGPAPAAEVLSSIFTGSRFDFVAIGRADDPSIVQRVILTPKGQPGTVAGAQQQPQARPNDNGEGGGDPDETPDEQVNVEPQDTAAQPPVPQPQPQTEQPQQQQPKTPEQLLQELQEMRKQQQMQQEGAPPPNPAQVPRKPPL